MSSHAILSPSSAHRWSRCPGSVVLEAQCPRDMSGEFADEGTAAHTLAEWALSEGQTASSFFGKKIPVNGKDWEVTHDMAMHVQSYVDYVLDIGKGALLVEQKLGISHITGEKDAKGTCDALVFDADTLHVIDLKFGRGVAVNAEDNEQLLMYALAAVEEYSYTTDFKEVAMHIVQPRMDNYSVWKTTVGQLKVGEERLKQAAGDCNYQKAVWEVTPHASALTLKPGDKQCQWCRAKASCPAIAQRVFTTLVDDFVDVGQPLVPQLDQPTDLTQDNAVLANKLSAVDMIEGWCKAVRAAVEIELLAHRPVPGYKLVQGRQGARKWEDAVAAEALMKSMRLKVDEMYELSLISPTSAEKLKNAKVIGARQWTRLAQNIVRAEGQPSVAPESDKRLALKIQTDASEFDDVSFLVKEKNE